MKLFLISAPSNKNLSKLSLFKNADSSSDGEFSSLSDEEMSRRSSRSNQFHYQSFSLVNNNNNSSNNNSQEKAQSPSRRTPSLFQQNEQPLYQQQQQEQQHQQQQAVIKHNQQQQQIHQQQQQQIQQQQQQQQQLKQQHQKQQQTVLEIVDETDGILNSSDLCNNSNNSNNSSRLQRVAVMEQKLWDIKHKSIPTRKSLLKPTSTTTSTISTYKGGQVNEYIKHDNSL